MLKYNTFIGKDMQDAMSKMRHELGPDALMLKHKVINTNGFLRLFKRPMVEVVGFKSDKYLFKQNNIIKKKNSNEHDITIQKELNEIKKQLEILANSGKPGRKGEEVAISEEDRFFNKFIKLLKDNDISEELIDKIIESLRKEINIQNIDDDKVILEKIKIKLIDIIEVVDPIKNSGKNPKIFMFVGPPGDGKTTTLVKLAANYKLKEGKQIEVYSLDNYRIAATEQLKSYSEIMQIPFKKFDNKIDFKNSLKKSKASIILIDTAGRSPKDEISISTIKDYMKSADLHNIEPFLVVSAATKKKDLFNIDEKYSRLDYKYLIFTKLDETMSLGSIIDVLYHLKKPVTYVTFGQDVPKHISIANPEILVESVLQI